jgi:hypothetical protein
VAHLDELVVEAAGSAGSLFALLATLKNSTTVKYENPPLHSKNNDNPPPYSTTFLAAFVTHI